MARKGNSFAAPVAEPETAEPGVGGIEEVLEPVAELPPDAHGAEPETAEPGVVPELAVAQPEDPVAEQLAQNVISNPGKNVRRIGGIVLAPGGVYALTEKDLADEKSMGKIQHMITLGVLHRGAD